MKRLSQILHKRNENCHPFGLAVFRVIFGLLLALGAIRFWAKGWIEELYLRPTFHFKYPGFSWVEVAAPEAMYFLYVVFILASVCVAFGLFYRVAIVCCLVLFAYFELLDLSYYLNHYYFITLMTFLLCFLPANAALSLDAKWKMVKPQAVKNWHVWVVKLQLGMVYFFAGVAKINPDWVLHALPMNIWLKAFVHLPLIGKWMASTAVAFVFSWLGMIYDLTIPFFLLFRKTRPYAYLAVVGFHVITWLMFPIGMFPFVMIGCTLIFFPAERLQHWVQRLFRISFSLEGLQTDTIEKANGKVGVSPLQLGLALFFLIQTWLPFRYLMYSGDLFWHEQGYRFSWRVMLIEKAGYATFYVADKDKPENKVEINNQQYLTPVQEKMMSTQPDFILQYAHYLKKRFISQGYKNPVVTADVFVTLNGRRSKRFVDARADLSSIEYSCKPYSFLLD